MDVWDLRLFHLSNLVGLSPFEVDRNKSLLRRVEWKSRQAIYFLVVSVMCQAYFLFYSGSLILLITRRGVAFSLRASPWIGAISIACALQWVFILRHEKIVTYLNSTFTLLGRQSLANLKWRKDKRQYFIVGFLAFGLIPFVLVSSHVCFLPGEIYIHSHLEAYHPEYNRIWRLISNVIHCYSALVCAMGAFFCDILLIFLSIGYFRHFQQINENLLALEDNLNVPEVNPSPKRNNILISISEEIDRKNRKRSISIPSKLGNNYNLHFLIEEHLKLQRSLNGFNYTFDDILLAFPVQIFVMVVALFFSIIRGEITDIWELLALLSVGAQFLFRSLIGLYNFGKVQDVGVEAKYILFRDLCVQYHRGYFKSEMAFEIESFCCVVDEVSVKAGSYVAFTKSALISFYGVLVSYMAIVVQSF